MICLDLAKKSNKNNWGIRMKNPFKKLTSKDTNKKFYEDRIKKLAWVISMKVISRRLKPIDIDNLALLYKEYFEKFPDNKLEQEGNKRISQLRTICN